MKKWISKVRKTIINKRTKFTLNTKLNLFAYGILILFTLLISYLIVAMVSFCNSYNQIVKNITAANAYNLDFKEDLDYVMYRMIAGGIGSDRIEEETELQNPYAIIEEVRDVFGNLDAITTGEGNQRRIKTILKSLSTLEKRVEEIDVTVEKPGHYDQNLVFLENNIRILTELTQEEIQKYIYYEAANLEYVRQGLEIKEKEAVTISILALVGVVVLTSIISLLISKSISKPIQNLCRTTELVAKGNFHTRAELTYGDEISSLTNSFNSMIGQIGDLVENIKEEQHNLRSTELKLLQAQINPHFLYNTLDTIIWLAEDCQTSQVVSIVTSLSDFFRTGLSDGRDFIRIQEEESHIRSYLEIQQFRYRDILEYELLIPKELQDYTIIKLTLQPIIENALYHGIKNKRGKGKIEVSAKRILENIEFSVCDNGIGMEEATLQRLNKEVKGIGSGEEHEKGFGLRNVEERIKLSYGEKYGLTFYSKYGEGTTVTVLLPAIQYGVETDVFYTL